MLRALLFLLAVIAVALGLSSIADRPGHVSVTWLGYEIETSVFVAILAFVVLISAVMLFWSLFRYIVTRPAALSRYVRHRQEERGLEALSQGLVAVGAGDRDGARRYATLARRHLPNEPLTGLLRAQAAQLSGERAEATRIFEAMAEQPATELLGLRGLFLEARREEEMEAARQFAERAVQRNPDLAWSVNALFDLQCRAGDWEGALRTLNVARRQKHIGRETADRRRAVLLLAQARQAEDRNPDRARELAIEASGLAPDLPPAAAMAARLLAVKGNVSRAERLLGKAWQRLPHPELAVTAAYLAPGEPPRDRLKRVKKLVQNGADGTEGALALAANAIEARSWEEAREALRPLISTNPTSRACTLMARIEAGERGDEGRVREWLSRALRAPRDPAWTADGFVSETWEPVSPVTGRLDAFEWKVPVEPLAPPAGDDAARGLARLDTAGMPIAPAPEAESAASAEDEDDAAPDGLVIEAGPAAPPPQASAGAQDAESAEPAPERAKPEEPEIYVPPRAPDDPGPDTPEATEAGEDAGERQQGG